MKAMVAVRERDVPRRSLTKSCSHSARPAPSFRPKEATTWTAFLTGNPGQGIGTALTTVPSVARRPLKSSSESKMPEGGLVSCHESQAIQSLPTLWGHID